MDGERFTYYNKTKAKEGEKANACQIYGVSRSVVVSCSTCLNYGESKHEIEYHQEGLERNVVAIADASAQPKTMVIKTTNTAVAGVAVDGAGWSKNQTCLTELYGLSQDWSTAESSLIHHQVKVALLIFNELVLNR